MAASAASIPAGNVRGETDGVAGQDVGSATGGWVARRRPGESRLTATPDAGFSPAISRSPMASPIGRPVVLCIESHAPLGLISRKT